MASGVMAWQSDLTGMQRGRTLVREPAMPRASALASVDSTLGRGVLIGFRRAAHG